MKMQLNVLQKKRKEKSQNTNFNPIRIVVM